MRLFQLARKLSTTTDNLISVLEQHNHEIENQSNAKLTEEQEQILTTHFNSIQEEESRIKEIELPEKEPIEIEVEKPEPDEVAEEVQEIPEKEPEKDVESNDEVEVIRVKKVKLDGPKVLGKIELPEPAAKAEPKRKEENRKREVKSKRRKSSRKSLTPEQLRLKERKEKEQQRRREERKKKKNRTKYYQENIQLKPDPVKKIKKKKIVEDKIQTSTPKKVEKHSNPVKRLWAWLNGEYDHF
ncbi:MAG: hypothetical protein AAGA02_11340 [Bacteroidota bacterium]